jgi:hypothetical protein
MVRLMNLFPGEFGILAGFSIPAVLWPILYFTKSKANYYLNPNRDAALLTQGGVAFGNLGFPPCRPIASKASLRAHSFSIRRKAHLCASR